MTDDVRRLNRHLPGATLRKLTPKERDEQALFVAWCHAELARYDWRASLAHAIPNALGAKRQPEAGTLPGMPDVMLPAPVYHYAEHRMVAGLYVEMKRAGEKAARHQTELHERLRRAGYAVEVCEGAKAAAIAAIKYLGLNPSRFDLSNL